MRADVPTAPGARACAGGAAAFTLLEVIFALALFSAAATMLAASFINVLNAMERVKSDRALEQELALIRAQVLLEPDRETVEEGGEVPTLTHGTGVWRAVVTPSEVIADLFRIELEIELAGDGERVASHALTQTVHVLRPQWSQPTERDALRAQSRERLDELKRGRSL